MIKISLFECSNCSKGEERLDHQLSYCSTSWRGPAIGASSNLHLVAICVRVETLQRRGELYGATQALTPFTVHRKMMPFTVMSQMAQSLTLLTNARLSVQGKLSELFPL